MTPEATRPTGGGRPYGHRRRHPGRIFWWFRSAPDRRLQQEVDELRWRLNKFESSNGRQQEARADADFFLGRAECELDQWHAATEEAWAWFHAARREELCFLPPNELVLVELDQKREVEEKLDSWRRKAVASYSCDAEDRIDRIVRTQMHIDETAENNSRKRLLQRRQLMVSLGFLVAVLFVLCLLEFLGRGLVLAHGDLEGWSAVTSVLFGAFGGAFSSAQRVATAGPSKRYPETSRGAATEHVQTAGRGSRSARRVRSPQG